MAETAVAKLKFGTWLMFKREILNLSQDDVANAIGSTKASLSNWESHRSNPKLTLDQLLTLCKILNVDIETLNKALKGEIEFNG